MKSTIVIALLFAAGIGLWFLVYRGIQGQPFFSQKITPTQDAPLPIAIPPTTIDEQPTTTHPNSSGTTTLPSHYVIDGIQFASQAPLKNWSAPYGEFCEETSSLITAFYALGKMMPDNNGINSELLRIKDFEEKTFGYYEDTTALETTRILKEFYGLDDVTLIKDPTVREIKAQLTQGNAVIVPSAGQMLGSPYYRDPGPVYHMLVIKGYTEDEQFITQDPGTNTKGKDYQFPIPTMMEAIHDWNGGDVVNGAKVVISVGKQKK